MPDNMVHTAELTLQIDADLYNRLTKQHKYPSISINLNRQYRPDSSLSEQGLTIRFETAKIKGNINYFIKLLVNFSKLYNPSEPIDLITESEVEEVCQKLKILVNTRFKGYNEPKFKKNDADPFGGLPTTPAPDTPDEPDIPITLDSFIVTRIDYTTQIYNLPQDIIDHYIDSVNKGYLKKYLTVSDIRTKALSQQEATKAKHEDFYSGSAYRIKRVSDSKKYHHVVNIYDKQQERINAGADTETVDKATGILRIEVQAYEPMINDTIDKSPFDVLHGDRLDEVLTQDISKKVILGTIEKICYKMPHYSAKETKAMIQKSQYKQPVKDKLMIFVDEANKPYEQLDKLEKKVSSRNYKTYISRFEAIGCNPITNKTTRGKQALDSLYTVLEKQYNKQ